MRVAFKALDARFGYPLGYFLAFLVYWFGWCLIFPAILLDGFGEIAQMFYPIQSFKTLDWQSQALIWWPILFPLIFMFVPRIAKASLGILISSVILGVLIGLTEEILWRGLFLQVFPGNFWLGMLYPSLLFGLWHIAPQSVLENRLPGGAFSFVGYAVVLGLSYALAAGRTGSIFWPAISHILHDTLGLGGFAYASWLGKHS